MRGYTGSRQEHDDANNAEWWADADPGLGPYEVRCNGCSDAIPDVLLCSHDEHATGPLCPGCCETEHPHQCRTCLGYGQVSDHIRPHHEALGRYRPCTTCGGKGRVNEGNAA